MRVIILAASRGIQLGELTKDIPKCLLNFGSETVLERQVRILSEIGFNRSDICVVAGYKHDKLKIIKGISFLINDRYEVTDNAYSLWLALRENNDDVLILDGDLVYEFEAIKSILDVSGNAILAMDGIQQDGNTGIIISKDGRVKEIGKHVVNGSSYIGIMKLTQSSAKVLLEHLKDNFTFWYTVALNKILDNQSFRVCYTSCRISNINTYGDYLEAKRNFGIEEHTIWVTGASGFLGQKVYHILKRNYNVVGTKWKNKDSEFQAIDLLNEETLRAYVKLNNPSIIVHTAGIPEPERCEENPKLAYDLNVTAVKNLVHICAEMGIKLIHISTDYVFDGESNDEYSKNASRNPKNYYGLTKRYAEDEVRKYGNSLIIRVPLLYGFNHKNDKLTFPIKVLQSLSQGQEIYLDNKQIRYPVLIDDVAFCVADSLYKRGLIHVTSAEPVTKYGWGKILAAEFEYDSCLVKEDVNSSLADRPKHIRLQVEEMDYLVTDVKKGAEILRKQMACVFQLIYKSNPVENVYGINIGAYRYELGQKLAGILPESIREEADCVVPVPLSGMYYAMGLAAALKVPYLQGLVKPDEMKRSFQIADISLREHIIRNNIQPIRELLAEKVIILVDEAIFTGITLRVVCDMLKGCGVGKIYIAIPTPICGNVCKQYVQPERRLLAQEMDEKDLANYFRVDGVFFQRSCEFSSSIQKLGFICCDCFCDKEG